MFKALNINLPLFKVLEKVLKYVKFLREVMFRRKNIKREKVPPKLKDSGSFTNLIEIGGANFGKALCDLGTSINLLSLSIYHMLGLDDLKETPVTLQPADKSLVHPKGVLDDVLVRVRQFILLIDFIVLHFNEDLEIPILLGEPFLSTSKVTIDVVGFFRVERKFDNFIIQVELNFRI
ncbi:hypothetical protein V6Z12_A01G085000 [Gossypium hirsutum]